MSAPSGQHSRVTSRQRLRRWGAHLYRRFGPEFVVEKGAGWVSYRGHRTVLLRKRSDAPSRGIYLRGACDVPSLFTLAPLVIDELEGSLCIHASGNGVSDARSDLLLQTHSGVSELFAEEIRVRFDYPPAYFAPILFEPRFSIRGLPGGAVDFPKSVVVLSVLPDISRTMYRHRETGYLIDPGTAWLSRVSTALKDLSFVKWFSERFEPIGRISLEEFADNYRRLIPLIEYETGARVLVFNSLEIKPGDPTYDYSLRNLESATRRRRFNIVLAELAGELGFRIVDVDRVLKQQGVDREVDFSHYPVRQMRAVGIEALRILREIGAV